MTLEDFSQEFSKTINVIVLTSQISTYIKRKKAPLQVLFLLLTNQNCYCVFIKVTTLLKTLMQ